MPGLREDRAGPNVGSDLSEGWVPAPSGVRAFYRLPVNDERVTLSTAVPAQLDFDVAQVVPFHAGDSLRWPLV